VSEHRRIVVIGAGFSGIGLGIRMLREGIEDFVVLEKASDLGGTWQANTYPGIQCDIPSHLYSLSFMPNPGWTRTFSEGSEIWDYLRRCARDGGIMPHLRLGCEVLRAEWDEAGKRWRIETSNGSFSADVLITATGGLSEPAIPDIPGLGSFGGALFHSARWDHEQELGGKRVAVVGTGASAIQIVPRLQRDVAKLYVFQRTPPWVMPHRDRPIPRAERQLYARLPAAQRLSRAWSYLIRESIVPGLVGNPDRMKRMERIGRAHLNRQVPDPELRARLQPSYRLGCKRILPSNEWYPALQQPNVELISGGVSEIRQEGPVGTDCSLKEVDVVVLATGFNVAHPEFGHRLSGPHGTVGQVWENEGAQAYLGTTIAGFPNLFTLAGPNTGLGHNSILYMIESQLNYVLDALRLFEGRGIARFEVRPEVQGAYNADLQRRLAGAVWSSGGCANWYLDEHGRNVVIWPRQTWSFRRLTRRFDPASYRLETARVSSSEAAKASTSVGSVSQEHISRTVPEGSSQR
jgi:cation diffusion facilitator CzcD-associated flavoprotein CzcO